MLGSTPGLGSAPAMEPESVLAYFAGKNSSNEAKMRKLERRLTGTFQPADLDLHARTRSSGGVFAAPGHSRGLADVAEPGSVDSSMVPGTSAETSNGGSCSQETKKRRLQAQQLDASKRHRSDVATTSNLEHSRDAATSLKRAAAPPPEAAPAVSPGSTGDSKPPKPRSASKVAAAAAAASAAAAARGQKKVHQFFSPVDGSSRESQEHEADGGEDTSPAAATAPAPQPTAAALPFCSHQGPSPAAAGLATGYGLSRAGSAPTVAAAAAAGTPSPVAAGGALPPAQRAAAAREVQEREAQLREREARLQAQLEAAARREAEMTQALVLARSEAAEARRVLEEREAKVRAAMARTVQAWARCENELTRARVLGASARLGQLGVQRTSAMGVQEVWEEGQAMYELKQRQAALARQREDLEAARKALKKRLQPPPSAARSTPAPAAAGGEEYLTPDEFTHRDEMLKARLDSVKRDEATLAREAERLEIEKMRQVRSLKRLHDEEGSRFNGHITMKNRYVMMNLMGKGGFSEVFKAFDLVEMREVAVKFHQLNSTWNEFKRSSYVRHAMREYNIHKELKHPHIVLLYDLYEIDVNSFATVLEMCEGGDLDTHLRERAALPEKEARAILSQLFSGLAYLNQPGRKIIHYDLKPANIMFDTLGQVKITDFGLSKEVADGQTMGIELTSQGAGTYWYLPPECFAMGAAAAPRISNKVDVWSAGIIFYQMLYGRRPFGEGCTQEQILRDRVMLNARQVEFPAMPRVSPEAKAFISRCLAYHQEERWDVLTAAADPYLNMKRGKDGPPAAGNA